MAETLISPGVLARENDQSQITSQPIQAGAALVGPTVKGQVNIPKLITTYSEYQANFGTTFDSGSDEYTFLTSISAYNYFQNGGTSLIVTRVASGSFSSATSSTIFNDQETGDVLVGTNLLGSWTSGGENGAAFENTVTPSTSGAGTGIVLAVTASNVNGKLVDTPDALLGSITTNTTTAGAGSYSVNLTNGSGTGAVATVVVTGTTAPTVNEITVTTSGSGYVATDVLTIPAGALGTGQLITGDDITSRNSSYPNW